MLSVYSAFAIIFVQKMTGSNMDHFPTGSVIVLGSLLFALGTIIRRKTSTRDDATTTPSHKPRPQSEPAESNRRTVNRVKTRSRATAA